jgi:hypothetical protein
MGLARGLGYLLQPILFSVIATLSCTSDGDFCNSLKQRKTISGDHGYVEFTDNFGDGSREVFGVGIASLSKPYIWRLVSYHDGQSSIEYVDGDSTDSIVTVPVEISGTVHEKSYRVTVKREDGEIVVVSMPRICDNLKATDGT